MLSCKSLKRVEERIGPNPRKGSVFTDCDSEEEVETGLETSATSTTASLGHLKPEEATELHQFFQKVPSLLSPNPDVAGS